VIAYFDESGSHEGTTVFGLACVVGREARWDVFRQRWQRLLHKEGLPDIHMADLEARKAQFEGWPAQRYRAVRDTIGGILTGSLWFYFFSNAFFMADYDAVIIRAQRRRQYYVRTPYTLSMQVLLEMMWDALQPRLRPGEQITCVFDRNDQVRGEATRIFADLMRKKPGWCDVYRGPLFESRLTEPPLQAADVFAYESRLAMEMMAGARRHAVRPLLRRLIATKRIEGKYYTRDEIRRLGMAMMRAAARTGSG
jgi:hypothetical protein